VEQNTAFVKYQRFLWTGSSKNGQHKREPPGVGSSESPAQMDQVDAIT
jgi:hypothetical protein